MPDSSGYAVVITTTSPEADAATKIIDALLTRGLAACVQVFPVRSSYRWKGELCVDEESLLLIKCKAELYPEIEACIKAHHAYETPEIVQLPIVAGSAAYLAWINEVSQ